MSISSEPFGFFEAGRIIILQENNVGSTVETFRSKIEDAGLGSHVVICHSAHETTNTISLESCGPVVFEVKNVNRRASRYMTIAWDVHPEWRARIPAVVHVVPFGSAANYRPAGQSPLLRYSQRV